MSRIQVMNRDGSQLEQTQAEKLTELGAYLRQLREESSLSIEQVATQTMIQLRLLKAIETGKLHQLPEPVYIRGFIKRYAEALGLDGAELANTFPTEPDIRAIQPSWKDSPAAQLRPIHLYVAYVFLIVAALSGLSYLLSHSASWVRTEVATDSKPTGQVPGSGDATNPQTAAAEGTTSTDVATNSPEETAQPVRVDITLTAQSWMRVVIDGKTEYEGVLSEGTQRTWTANSQLTVRAGNAGGVMLTYNEGQAERMGDPGAVKEVTFSASQDAASLPDATTSTSE